MSEAHPAITPLDFRKTDIRDGLWSSDHVALYDLIRRRSLASLGPHPVLEEWRRVLAFGDVRVALGWLRMRELGWVAFLSEVPPPEPAVPSASNEPIEDSLVLLNADRITVDPPRIDLAGLVEIMRSEQIGRPSTLAATIGQVLKRKLIQQDDHGFVCVAPEGQRLLEALAPVTNLPVLDAAFSRELEENLGRIESGSLRPSDVLESQDALVEASVRSQLAWLDVLGEPFAGELAEVAYLRRDKQRLIGPFVYGRPEDPELTLASDHPLRKARASLFDAVAGAIGDQWWRIESSERSGCLMAAVLQSVSVDREAWSKRIRYDALVRWSLGIEGTPTMDLRKHEVRLMGQSSDMKETIREAATVLAKELALLRD